MNPQPIRIYYDHQLKHIVRCFKEGVSGLEEEYCSGQAPDPYGDGPDPFERRFAAIAEEVREA